MRRIEDRIQSREQFYEWVEQDRISCGYRRKVTLREKIKGVIAPNYILRFLYLLRSVEYLTNCRKGPFWGGTIVV